MAHTYTLKTIEHLTGTDIANVSGTVDSLNSFCTASWNSITSAPNSTALENYLSPLMLAGVVPSSASTINNQFNGTWVQ